MKAIQTSYKGFHFRSRLEARWAVFFDQVGVKWDYEIEGFELDDGRCYLPDFWLPAYNTWIEIKGEVPSEEYVRLIQDFSDAAEKTVVMLNGAPWSHKANMFGCIRRGQDEKESYTSVNNKLLIGASASALHFISPENRLSDNTVPTENFIVYRDGSILNWCIHHDDFDRQETVHALYEVELYTDRTKHQMNKAISAAKIARFEFGETPR